MYSLAKSFKQILITLTHSPECERLEPMLADFASQIGAEGRTLVYCQFEHERFLPVGAAVSLLNPYSVQLLGDWRNGKRFIYAAPRPLDPQPFPGAVVLEHVNTWEVAA
jgi:hypothetical protein